MADNDLRDKSPAELHDMGLTELAAATDSVADNAWGARKASTAIAFFFAAMSAENLGTEVGAHRADSGEHPVDSLTGNHA